RKISLASIDAASKAKWLDTGKNDSRHKERPLPGRHRFSSTAEKRSLLVIARGCVNLPSRMRLQRQNYQDIERIIEFDFVRATEAAALNSLRWLGRGDKEAADAAACDAMRGMFDLMN